MVRARAPTPSVPGQLARSSASLDASHLRVVSSSSRSAVERKVRSTDMPFCDGIPLASAAEPPASSTSGVSAQPSDARKSQSALTWVKRAATSAAAVRSSPHVRTPSAPASTFSCTRPMPQILRTGSGSRKVAIASRTGRTENCPFGLRWSAATLASRKFGARPADTVSPPVASHTRARISCSTASASAKRRSRAAAAASLAGGTATSSVAAASSAGSRSAASSTSTRASAWVPSRSRRCTYRVRSRYASSSE
mmetsp:Transcript_3928/g.10140  ORF Transcript_3928/g.10140 Transcript_3928/m.10140 type:complete len:253 (+) Transcript_3928:284-1042(+)